MSLAEPKKKQRIVADPQNKKWSEDKSGFGFKMLQKMGWKEGAGLGANLDGTTEHVKVSLKTDSAGLGVTKRDLAEDTYGHTKSFDDLLKNLSSSCSKSEKKSSKKVKNSKKEKEPEKRKRERKEKKEKKSSMSEKKGDKVSKFHRKKYIQNKNVASYSAAQLKEIFGV